ncbi:hypothetical protein PybrP1_002006 [[Pythium] brassicae (nom. inval.)]|nr:hypothetical protein PybrP1_002006 [[Pythium] brassicae (nom. inval.)]
MDRMRAALDEAIEKVRVAFRGEPKSPVELLLDQHLPLRDDVVSFSPKNCGAAAVPTFALTELASRSNNIVDYPFILERIWDILIEAQHEPPLLKKALALLHFLLVNGSIQVLKDCQDPVRMDFFRELAADYNRVEFEQYTFSKHLDVGAGVRKAAAEIHHLLSHERELLHARRSAEKLHQSLSDRGLRNAYPSPRGDESLRSAEKVPASIAGDSLGDASRPPKYSDPRPPKYTDSLPTGSAWEDIGARIITHSGSVLDDLPIPAPSSRQNKPTAAAATTDGDLLRLDEISLSTPLPALRRQPPAQADAASNSHMHLVGAT